MTGPLPLPIFIPLSLYADHRRQFADHPDPRQRQLATFIDCYLHERQLNLPADFCATLFEQGRHLILLLDGLDEVPNEDERALVSQAVRDLKFGQPHARFIVTSRTPAYVGRAVLGDEFRVIRVPPARRRADRQSHSQGVSGALPQRRGAGEACPIHR